MRRGWKIALLFWVSLVLVTEPFPNENIEEMGATKILSIQGESEYLQKITFIRDLTVISTFSHTMSQLDFDSHCVFLSIDEGVFKAGEERSETRGAAEVQEDEDTQVEIPLDQVVSMP